MKVNEETKTEGTDPAPTNAGRTAAELLSAADTPPEVKWASPRDLKETVASATIEKMVIAVVACVWRQLPAAIRIVLQKFAPDTVLLFATKQLPIWLSAGILPGSRQVVVDVNELVAPFDEGEASCLADGLCQAFLDAWLHVTLGLARNAFLASVERADGGAVDPSHELVAAALVNDLDVFKDQPKLLLAMSEGIAQVLGLVGPKFRSDLDPSKWTSV